MNTITIDADIHKALLKIQSEYLNNGIRINFDLALRVLIKNGDSSFFNEKADQYEKKKLE